MKKKHMHNILSSINSDQCFENGLPIPSDFAISIEQTHTSMQRVDSIVLRLDSKKIVCICHSLHTSILIIYGLFLKLIHKWNCGWINNRLLNVPANEALVVWSHTHTQTHTFCSFIRTVDFSKRSTLR